MSRKLLITLGAVSVIVVAGVASAGIVAYNSCGYDARTGNYLYDGNKVAAHGTMDSAMQCALQGILPDVVASRLGMWGDTETKEEAEQINLMNELKKEEQKRPKE
jgi:hypothetical protein